MYHVPWLPICRHWQHYEYVKVVLLLQEVDVPRLWSQLVKAGTAVSECASSMDVDTEGQFVKIMLGLLLTL